MLASNKYLTLIYHIDILTPVVNLLPKGVLIMTKVLGRIRTADGYVFYHLADDSIVDSLDPASVDMSWASLRQFAQANGDDGTATMDWTVLWTYMTAREED